MNTELLKELIDCAKRECMMRERVYPKWIMQGRMTDSRAAREKYLMGQIKNLLIAIYEQAAPDEVLEKAEEILK